MAFKACRNLEPERRQILATAFPELGTASRAVAVLGVSADGAKVREFVAVIDGGSATLLMGSCQITYDDISASECVEYAFDEEPGKWAAAQLSLEALENYRG